MNGRSSKPRLVIGSVLRPVDDHRMYEKLGIALDELGKHAVHIIGFRSQALVRHKNIVFHPLFDFKRLSVERFLAPVRFLKKLFQLKPEVVIVNSPDLLQVTICYKILFGKKIVYDILENYHANVMFANTFKPFVRCWLASGVRLTEWLSRPFIDEYWLAERVYEVELPFVKNKFRMVENRFAQLTDVVVRPRRGRHRLLYSGTIAEAYGVFDAIDLVKRLHAVDSRYTLTIIGFAAQPSVQDRLYKVVEGHGYIQLIGIHHYVPHSLIFKQIQQSDIALLPYRVNAAVAHRIPTKFYEYLAFSLPFIVAPNVFWQENCLLHSTTVGFMDISDCKEEDFIGMCKVLLGNTNIYGLDKEYYTIIFSNFYRDFC